MFLRTLRDLNVSKKQHGVVLSYRCKSCDILVCLTLRLEEYEDLKNGLPVNFVFPQGFVPFKNGLCEKCSAS